MKNMNFETEESYEVLGHGVAGTTPRHIIVRPRGAGHKEGNKASSPKQKHVLCKRLRVTFKILRKNKF